MQPVQQVEQRNGQPPQKAVVDGQVQVRGNFFQDQLIFWPSVKLCLPAASLTRRNFLKRRGKAENISAIVAPVTVEGVFLFRISNPGTEKIVLQK